MKFEHTILLHLISVVCLLLTASAQAPRPFGLQPLSPKFWDLVDPQAKLETVATGFGFTEGPMWDAAGFLYVSDETINKIFRVYPNGKKRSPQTARSATAGFSARSLEQRTMAFPTASR
jgi:sugar lactone lactonase YvrE